jgi:hypothetical protein
MILVRNSFTAKPGQASKLLAQLKDMASAGKLRNTRFLTDLAGRFNTVVMEHEVESLAEWEGIMEGYRTDPQVRAAAGTYAELWTTGKRELFRIG